MKKEVNATDYEVKILEMWEAWQALKELPVEDWTSKGKHWFNKVATKPPVKKYVRALDDFMYDYSKCIDLQWLTEQVGKIRGKYIEKVEIEHSGDMASDILRERERLGVPSKVLGSN